ncbi:beta-N-acetylhexosaminidase [Adhaeribacter aquaticus]|uniref:beta-N-acetylhexosaminidase n=1 Tax=Adhaeribacter aquaticus TaxID=299567 RepID=UPI000558E51C|nr:family 20 glycosylhydrolase [Adhaeribacter aquaticus]
MRKFLLLILFSLYLFTGCAQSTTTGPTLNLMPVPGQLTMQDGKFRIADSFKLAVTGQPHQRLFKGATRFLRRLDDKTGSFLTQNQITSADNDANAPLVINVKRPGKVMLHEDESYTLTVSPQKVNLTAETDLGALHGLETLLQLVEADETGYYMPAIHITDKPRFPWRGLLMDVGRHFMPMEVIKRNLDGMAAVKMNVLHLHLSEDQGFPIESKVFPKLHQLGSNGNYFTQEEIKAIIKYADDRGIRVVPEFDMPGHATAWFVGHPELASAPGPYTIERRWGIMDPVMDPTKETTYKFLDAFLKEMTALFPDAYFHIGGDENNGKQWKANAQIQAYMKTNNIKNQEELHAMFNERILKILTKYGKKMVGWDEILQPGITKSIVIQSWRGKKYLYEAVSKGYQAMLSNGYYIDLVQNTEQHYLNDPLPEENQKQLTPEQQKLILGGEATMWSELVTPETVDSRVWPRTAAIAERLWSPGSVKDVADMYRRLDRVSLELEYVGLTHEKNYPMMLRRLANGQDITALKTFTDVIEPIKEYTRHQQGTTYYAYSPYTLIADAARPDAKVARNFRNLAKEFVTNPTPKVTNEITYWLNLWQNNHAGLQAIIRQAPALKEIETLSADLAKVSQIGLEAVNALKANKANLSEEWYNSSIATMQAAKKQRGKTELVVLPGIEALIKKAAGK